MKGNFDFSKGTTRFESQVGAGEDVGNATWLMGVGAEDPYSETLIIVRDTHKISRREGRRTVKLAHQVANLTFEEGFRDGADEHELVFN
ncbi:hypothetical protein H6800_00850 [Candidatus Nomurabacteria bacterium]|nr:hypothetical protein [Candidatus Nomurabacteria bacterium]